MSSRLLISTAAKIAEPRSSFNFLVLTRQAHATELGKVVVEACDVEADLRGLDVLPLVSPPAAAPDGRPATPAAPHQRLRLAVRAVVKQQQFCWWHAGSHSHLNDIPLPHPIAALPPPPAPPPPRGVLTRPLKAHVFLWLAFCTAKTSSVGDRNAGRNWVLLGPNPCCELVYFEGCRLRHCRGTPASLGGRCPRRRTPMATGTEAPPPHSLVGLLSCCLKLSLPI